jgi:hypothetical protein
MEAEELAETVRRAVQITVAGAVSAHLAAAVPSLPARALLTAAAAGLAVGAQRALPAARRLPSAAVVADLALAVASATLIQEVPAAGGRARALTLAHLFAVLLAGCAVAPLALGRHAADFLANTQYLTAGAVAGTLLSSGHAAVALAGAAACVALSGLGGGVDAVLCTALAQAAVAVLRGLALDPLPAGLRLPTVVALLGLLRPLPAARALGRGDALYPFALYQAGGALQGALQGLLPPAAAALAAVTLVAAAPLPVFRVTAQIAAVGAVTAWVMTGVREAADTDPFPALLSLLVFAQVLMAGVAAP